MGEESHILDEKIKYKAEDHVDQIHENNLDVQANHIYLMGEETYAHHEVDGAEPGVEFLMANRFIKNVNILMRKNPEVPILLHMKTCFSRKTTILTDTGQKKIPNIKIGDLVLTHKGRFRPVIDIMSHFYEGEMVSLFYSRNKHASTSITATAEHPILVERDSQKMWIPIKQVEKDDVIFVESAICEVSGEKVPFWRRRKNFNCDRLRRKKTGSQQDHLEKDILPFCDKLEGDGWQVIPVGAGVIPDIIGIKDGKIVAFEVEKLTGKSLEVKKEKYIGASILKYVDEVKWCHPQNKNTDYFYGWYELDAETGFTKVKVTSKESWKNKTKQRVFNLSVEEDNSFVANHVVVHNCGGDWNEGMAIYDMIKACPVPVTILSYTHARSMSSLIFQAANKRVMMKNSYFMLHDGTYAIDGTVKQVESAVEFSKLATHTMIEIYVEVMKRQGKLSRKSKEFIRTWIREQMDKKEDVYLTAEQAVEYGLADEIFGSEGKYDWGKLTTYTDEQLSRG